MRRSFALSICFLLLLLRVEALDGRRIARLSLFFEDDDEKRRADGS
jgi:hypothetical protein